MKNIQSTIIIVLCTFTFSICFYFLNELQKMKHNYNSNSKFTTKIQMKEDFLRLNFELNLKMTGLKAPDTDCVEVQKMRKNLYDIVNDKPLLIYRLNGSNCTTCNNDVLLQLKNELLSIFSDDKMIVLSSQHGKRDLLIFKRKNNIKFPIYLIPEKSFDWIVEEHSVPYFFVLHHDMKISHIYVPNNDYTDLNKLYLEEVKRFLSDGELITGN